MIFVYLAVFIPETLRLGVFHRVGPGLIQFYFFLKFDKQLLGINGLFIADVERFVQSSIYVVEIVV